MPTEQEQTMMQLHYAPDGEEVFCAVSCKQPYAHAEHRRLGLQRARVGVHRRVDEAALGRDGQLLHDAHSSGKSTSLSRASACSMACAHSSVSS